MTKYLHRRLPEHSTLLSGRLPKDEFGFESSGLQIWYNHADESWLKGVPEVPHKHSISDEIFIVLKGKLIVSVEDEIIEVSAREYCCFPKEVYHAILEVQPPAETLMIRAPSVDDKVYLEK